jgi:HEAT repeat protein
MTTLIINSHTGRVFYEALLIGNDVELQAEAIQAFGDHKVADATMRIITVLLNSKHMPNRAAAAIALGKIGDRRAVGALRKMMGCLPLAAVCAKALAAIGDKSALESMEDALRFAVDGDYSDIAAAIQDFKNASSKP